MSGTWRRVLQLIAFLAALLGALGTAAAEEWGWYVRKSEGWFWYIDPAPVEEALPDEEASKEPLPTAARPTGQAFSAAWLRENLDRFRDLAIDQPTPENVRLYAQLQLVALNKASAFAEAWQQVVLGDPVLDAVSERPLARFGVEAAAAAADLGKDRALADLAREAGLVVFVGADCPTCAAQLQVVETARRLHGFEVVGVSLDGTVPADTTLERVRVDAGEAAYFGVEHVPAIGLLRPPGDALVLAQGPVPLRDLEDRMLRLAHAAGWIDPAAYAAAQPVRLPAEALPSSRLPASLTGDPRALAALAERLLAGGTETPR